MGPNYCWHIDGYDKLKPYGFPIHGCIDGWSRKIMWLRVPRTNNNPTVIAQFYLQTTMQFNDCLKKLWSDCGTENGDVDAIQCYFRSDEEAHIYRSSPHNQRTEGWWSFFRKAEHSGWSASSTIVLREKNIHLGMNYKKSACGSVSPLFYSRILISSRITGTHIIYGSQDFTLLLNDRMNCTTSVSIMGFLII